MSNTKGYVEPTLYLTIKYPDNQLFLYSYKNIYPEVIKLPKLPDDICSHKEGEYVSKLMKEYRQCMDISNYGEQEVKTVIKEEDYDDSDSNNLFHRQEPELEGINSSERKIYLNSKLIREIKQHTLTERQVTLENNQKQLMLHLQNIEALYNQSYFKRENDLIFPHDVERNIVNSNACIKQEENSEMVLSYDCKTFSLEFTTTSQLPTTPAEINEVINISTTIENEHTGELHKIMNSYL